MPNTAAITAQLKPEVNPELQSNKVFIYIVGDVLYRKSSSVYYDAFIRETEAWLSKNLVNPEINHIMAKWHTILERDGRTY